MMLTLAKNSGVKKHRHISPPQAISISRGNVPALFRKLVTDAAERSCAGAKVAGAVGTGTSGCVEVVCGVAELDIVDISTCLSLCDQRV